MKNLNKEDIRNILKNRVDNSYKGLKDIAKPSLLKDSIKATNRLITAIKNKEKILIIGDYDVDGVVSTCIMKEFFAYINYPVKIIIPNRFKHGYGLSKNLIEDIDTNVIITVDNGINANEAAKYCLEKGIDLIISDHHTPPKVLPKAFAIINPKLKDDEYPFKDICGAQVAWLFIALIKEKMLINLNMSIFLDLLSLAIVSDLMPLLGINRSLVKKGLYYLNNSKRQAFIVLKEFLNKKNLLTDDIAFSISPRINSAGRLKDASIALDFLSAKSKDYAYKKLLELNELNENRKELQALMSKSALKLVKKDKKIIVVSKEDWNEGVVGIIASNLVDKLNKPCIVLSQKENYLKGSARSFAKVDLFSLILSQKEFLKGFGGHKMACGLSLDLENLKNFEEGINKEASFLNEEDFLNNDDILGILDLKEVDLELLSILDEYEPFGEANKRPKFFLKDANIIDIKNFGSNQNHTKLKVSKNNYEKDLFLFKNDIEFKKGDKITCSFFVNKNEWQNNIKAQIILDRIY